MRLTKFGLIAIASGTICGAAYQFRQNPEQPFNLQAIESRQKNLAELEDRKDVYYARTAIPRGSVINMAFLSTQRISSNNVPLGAVTTFAQLSDCITRNDITSGEIIETRDLLPVRSALESTVEKER